MTAAAYIDHYPTHEQLDLIADSLVEQGYIVLNDFFPPALTLALAMQVRQIPASEFKRAAIGRARQQHLNQFVRTDEIHWLNGNTPEQQHYLEWMKYLRVELNRRLFMGLFDFESHFAHYQPGDYYKRHLDAFKGRSNRVLSSVFYLNPDWLPEDGGELLMYQKKQAQPFLRLLPVLGTLILFLSERFPHEVLAANRDRYSVTGWFRINTSSADFIDPGH